MTNEETIKNLKKLKSFHNGSYGTAIDHAIKALEQQPCEDCISREDAKNLFWDGTEGYDCRGFTRMEIGEMLDDLPSVTPQQTGWIPVSERLPEANGRYIVTRGLNACGALWNKVYIVNYSDLMGLKSERIWWSGNVGKSDFERIDDVKAWMPLPQPYAESEDKE